ncbi:MAG TPA: DUF2268 domain-containing putative Zn-dependent protease [Burkholderiales bacterium]|nr:DUF2268 domain-containing putative Zn-dependent protease [Burkholderiales bacterium]
MGSDISLHILDARGNFRAYRERLTAAFSDGVAAVTALVPISQVDVVVHAARFVHPETGMRGYAPSDDVVYITLDPANGNLGEQLEVEFVATLGHELHTCARSRGPGYGSTLAETLVSEGLACQFEKELRGGRAPFYARSLDGATRSIMHARARSEYASTSFDFRAWFFGSDEKQIPRNTGFDLGFDLVDGYLRATGVPASKLCAQPADAFLKPAH